MRTKSLLAAAAALTLLVACGDDDDDSAGDSAEALCGELVELAGTVATIAGADVDAETTTIDDVTDALGTLEAQIDEVQNAESALSESVRSDLADAYENYVGAVADIDDESTLAEAGAAVESARTEFREAWEATLSELDCRPTQST